MARIRTIKPDFFTSEDIVLLSPLARLFYIALWCEADKEGRFAWKPKTFKLRYLPGDNCDIEALADELLNARLVMLYEGGTLAYIPSFAKHQHINPRETASVLPDPNSAPKRTRAPRVVDASPREEDAQGGREGKGSINPLPLSGGGASDKVHEFPPGFDRFWQAYPRKTAKPQAAKAFARLRPDEPLLQRMLAALDLQRQSPQWQRDGGQFVPHPSTWINGRRWEDELSFAEPQDAFAGAL